MTAKMNPVPAVEILDFESRQSDRLRLQVFQRRPQTRQILRVDQDQQIQIPAKFRRAVEYARLAAHEQRSHATLPDRRKGSEYRVRAQAILPTLDRFPRASSIP